LVSKEAMMELRRLVGRVAVVTGASRGAGRGIAVELGAARATVYVTGRSVRGAPGSGYEQFLNHVGLDAAPGTVEATAEEITSLGGKGIAVRCDHTNEPEVAALFEHIDRENGQLDLLVNNAWGGYQHHVDVLPFWEQPTAHWEGMFHAGLRNHFLASRYAAPLLIRQRHGLIVTTTAWDRDRYLHTLYYDVAKAAINRLAFGMAQELHQYGVASVALAPGWMRTEFVLSNFRTDEAH
jgi:NAD(P)-dependent dehydrogenase (short-subunit alcohol dehydrogenase family)